MRTLTTGEWALATAGLWVVLVIAYNLSGLPSVIVKACALAGFLVLLADQSRNLRASRGGRR